jgi:hypothetical protein
VLLLLFVAVIVKVPLVFPSRRMLFVVGLGSAAIVVAMIVISLDLKWYLAHSRLGLNLTNEARSVRLPLLLVSVIWICRRIQAGSARVTLLRSTRRANHWTAGTAIVTGKRTKMDHRGGSRCWLRRSRHRASKTAARESISSAKPSNRIARIVEIRFSMPNLTRGRPVMSMYALKTNPRIASAKRSQAAAAGGAGRSPGSQPKLPPVAPQCSVRCVTA